MTNWLSENSMLFAAKEAVESSWLGENWLSLVAVVVGAVLCTLAGLLSLTPDPEKPAKFLPVYLLSIVLFLVGLALVMRLGIVMQFVEQIVET